MIAAPAASRADRMYIGAAPLPRHLLLLSMTTAPPPLANYLRDQNIDATIVATPASAPTDTVAESAASLGLSDASRVVKSLVFVSNKGTPLLVLAPGTVRVDKAALEQHVGCRVRFATPAEAEAATGHVVGSIPPICIDGSDTLVVLMDRAILVHDTIYAGAGEPFLHLCIPPSELLRVSSAALGNFTLPPEPQEASPVYASAPQPPPPQPPSFPAPLPVLQDVEKLLVPGTKPDEIGTDERPGGPDASPLPLDVARVLAAKSLSPTPIELPRAEVLRVRRQAKELLFATLRVIDTPVAMTPTASGDVDWKSGDVAPDDGCWYGKDSASTSSGDSGSEDSRDGGSEDSGDSRSGDSRRDAAEPAAAAEPPELEPPELHPLLSADSRWQLIVGKTLHGMLGSEAARELTRAVRPGAIIRAAGRAQLNPRLTGPDLVARSLFIIEPAQPLDPVTRWAETPPKAERPAAPAQPPPPPPAPPTATRKQMRAPPGDVPPWVLVDDAAGLARLTTALDRAMDSAEPIGLDGEWRPRRFPPPSAALDLGSEDDPPLALLQVGTNPNPNPNPPLALLQVGTSYRYSYLLPLFLLLPPTATPGGYLVRHLRHRHDGDLERSRPAALAAANHQAGHEGTVPEAGFRNAGRPPPHRGSTARSHCTP